MDNMINDSEAQLKETLGGLLKRSRTKQSKTLEEAAKTTRVHLHFLQALEDDDFSALPAEVFVRGFIKIYAGFLGLDPEDTIRHYTPQDKTDRESPDEKPSPRDLLTGETLAESTSFFRKNGKVIAITILLAVLLLFYGLGIFFKSSNIPNDLQTSLIDETIPADRQNDITMIEGEEQESITVERTGQVGEEEPAVLPEISQAERNPTSRATVTETGKEPPPETVPAEIPASVETSDIAGSGRVVKNIQGTDLPKTVKVATNPLLTDNLSDLTDEFKYVLEAQFNESSLVTITVDDKQQRQYVSQAGIVRVWKANEKIALELDNRNGVTLTLNGKVLNPVDQEEPEATIRIPEDATTSHQP